MVWTALSKLIFIVIIFSFQNPLTHLVVTLLPPMKSIKSNMETVGGLTYCYLFISQSGGGGSSCQFISFMEQEYSTFFYINGTNKYMGIR